MDRPVGELIWRTAISHFRPAHVHFLINVPGNEPLITQLFQAGAESLDSDVDRPWLQASYDVVLQPLGQAPDAHLVDPPYLRTVRRSLPVDGRAPAGPHEERT